METIAVINQKGGVGKSTTANALGAGLAQRGYKVLAVDLDAQCNLTYSYNVLNIPLTSLEMLTGTATAEEAIQHTEQGDIIPATPGLAVADHLLDGTGKEYKLKEALEPIRGSYDFIILDTPPSLGVLTTNALTACDSVLIPAQADVFSLQGIGQLASTISAIRKYTNPSIKIDGLLITRHKARTVLGRDLSKLLEQTADQLGTKVYSTPIRECTALPEAQALQTNIFAHAPRSNATADYKALVDEFLKNRG